VISVGVFPHVTLNGYHDVMGITAAQWHDVIYIYFQYKQWQKQRGVQWRVIAYGMELWPKAKWILVYIVVGETASPSLHLTMIGYHVYPTLVTYF